MTKAEHKDVDTLDSDADFAASFVLNRDDVDRALASTSSDPPERPAARPARFGSLPAIGLRGGLICVAVVGILLLLLTLVL